MKNLLLFVPMLCVFMLSCSVTDSENIKTSGIWAHYVIEEDESGTVTALAALRVGGSTGTVVDLTGGEYIECNDSYMEEYVELITNMHWSRAVVDFDSDYMYDFTFVRTDEEVSTEVELPAVPEISGLEPSDTVYEGESLTIYWDATLSEDTVDIFVEGTCIENIALYDVADDGEYTVASVNPDYDVNIPDCEIDVYVRRILLGQVNSAFQGGYTEGRSISHDTLSFQVLLID
ncbi:MAG: hypothetical protein JXR95_13575 [Deltaproteobacteria bacterium]|nr:hypothetical protein [Deltaproteobacteria bacterium]